MSIHELQAALRALDEAMNTPDVGASYDAGLAVIAEARRVAEGAGEPVAWRWPGGAWQDGDPSLSDKAQLKAAGVAPEFAYTTPPSADALVEALGKANELLQFVEWVQPSYNGSPACPYCDHQRHMGHADGCVLAAHLAKHKENTSGR